VIRMENTNARYLTKTDFPETIDGVVTDVSFISLRHIFPAIKRILGEQGEAIVLVKPQFECEKKHVGKSGIVSPSMHEKIVEKVLGFALENGLYPMDITNAPIRKGKNVEYVLRLATTPRLAEDTKRILKKVKDIHTQMVLERKTKDE